MRHSNRAPEGRGRVTTAATVALNRAGVAFTPHVYDHDSAATDFGAEAAVALGVEPDRVFKTLMVDTDNGLAIGIVSVSSKLDVKALAAAVGAKRGAMAEAVVAERKSGYVVGGISPFGQKTALPTVLDDLALLFETIYVSGGRRGFDVEVSPADLVAATRGQVAVIRRA
ncbi:Cys-tRNA(Pro) deacylase [Subtercola boreus]|uniref:Cys-tRNA(Pro)/Cys-tRNA(Cys) deacylase n=1 Tax=Subtercola boreus TaxID=120213 RepID=A0A3E0WAC1_9MICO|nr:Cys-tRNA(Pro) deacylase [Subtercola boreus]RFA19484.1 aminoacyl-tRNA deacylase [Subtercola boreus]RFA19745.1 aminoacyl-tRNA deacylase [Subtercola boreus]RFA26111.1 aminoacyl-tRNA deacylase [Subtercola boreus]